MKLLTLREARHRAKFSQVALAQRAGLEQTVISKLELGKIANPSFETVKRLSVALNIDPLRLKFGVQAEAIAS